MQYISRQEQIQELFPNEPGFRLNQIEESLFQPSVRSWNDVTSLSKSMREKMTEIPFQSLTIVKLHESTNRDTFKAVVRVEGEMEIETVLMKNRRDLWTICVSSQVGCAMGCTFCATGKMGLIRQLHADEIIDQYRLWQTFLLEHHPELPERISNVVFMGMGEPLSNYENVRSALNTLLARTDLGQTRITVSTVGVLPRLEQILVDPEWPHVRMAVSLHSEDRKTRKEIVPTSYDDFLKKLSDWAKRYLELFGNRRHHLTFEYVMLSGINDSLRDAKQLANFVNSIGNVRVNLIPYNFTGGSFSSSSTETLDAFEDLLERSGVTVTRRRTMGDDIEAACGQLVRSESEDPT